MKKRLTSLLLVLALLVGVIGPVQVRAVEETFQGGAVVNPLYTDLPAPDSGDADNYVQAQTRSTRYVSTQTAVDQLRQAMMARNQEISLMLREYPSDSWFYQTIFQSAYSQDNAVCAYDGDYLRWSWYSVAWNVQAAASGYQVTVRLQYYTSGAEEAAVAQQVTDLVTKLGVRDMEPVLAYETIYDYVTTHVTYDSQGLANFADDYKDASGKNVDPLGNDDYYIYTAYGALNNGTAVCQGYAALYYAMCWEAGLPTRIVTSTTHAWNIVYLKNIWYEVDATWDSSTLDGKTWFLRGTDTFGGGDHTLEAEYTQASYVTNYPISTVDYDPDIPYNDVLKTSGAYEYIRKASQLGLFYGTSTYTFSPGMEMTRGMLVTILWRMSGEPKATREHSFSDVNRTLYYSPAISWAAEIGIVKGYDSSSFGPNDALTRQDMVTIFYRYAEYCGVDGTPRNDLAAFRDRKQVASYALDAMEWAVATELVNGVAVDQLAPRQVTTREMLAILSVRLVEKFDLKVA
jgi:hypothetical protein